MSHLRRAAADQIICDRLVGLAGALGPSFVLGYLALSDEVRVDGFLAAMVESDRTVLLPRVCRGNLTFGPWRPETRLSRDDKGVLAAESSPLDRLPNGRGLLVVPGRAFDESAGRVGRGGGYYDRLLSDVAGRCWTAGAGYEVQVYPAVPRAGHDRGLDYLVTEAGCRNAQTESTNSG